MGKGDRRSKGGEAGDPATSGQGRKRRSHPGIIDASRGDIHAHAAWKEFDELQFLSLAGNLRFGCSHWSMLLRHGVHLGICWSYEEAFLCS